LSGASPIDINGGDFSPSLFSKTNFAEAGSAPLTKPQIIPFLCNKSKNFLSTNNSSFLMNPDQYLLSLFGSPPK